MKKLTDIRVMAFSAMLLAIAVVLGFFRIPVTQLIEIRLQFLPIAAEGMLFGPAMGALLGALSDILGFLVRPTGPFFPGFTISAALEGVIYGFLLYGKKPSFKAVITAQTLDMIFVSFLLNPLWLSLLYGQGFMAVFSARILKNLIMFPINILLLMAVMQPVYRLQTGYFKKDG